MGSFCHRGRGIPEGEDMKNKRMISMICVSVSLVPMVIGAEGLLNDRSTGDGQIRETTILNVARYLKERDATLDVTMRLSVAQVLYDEAARQGVDYRLALAIMAVESNFRHLAVSPDGARGIMQVKPMLARWLSGESGDVYGGAQDLLDPVKNIRWGLQHLSRLQETFSQTADVLNAYNAGHRRARIMGARLKKTETVYVRRIMREYAVTRVLFPAFAVAEPLSRTAAELDLDNSLSGSPYLF